MSVQVDPSMMPEDYDIFPECFILYLIRSETIGTCLVVPTTREWKLYFFGCLPDYSGSYIL